MRLLDKRIQGICDELKKYSVQQRVELSGWRYKKGNFILPNDANGAQAPFEPFDSRHMRWYGPDEHYWFQIDIEVPASFAGKPLWLYVRTQIEEWDDAKNPQFLLFVNEQAVQGIDMNHREVLLDGSAVAGQKLRIDLQSYTGTLHSEFHLIAELRDINPDILGLYWDMQVPLQAFPRLDEQSQSRLKLEHVLNSAVNLLDLRTPYSEAYLRSVVQAREFLATELYEKLTGDDAVIASCIGHTHIDVAWWWTIEQTREKVGRSFATVLKLMDEYPDYAFMSSQPVLYAFLKERFPDLYVRVKERVAQKRWEPEGGTWVEMDCNLTSGESIVRQFIHGKRFFREEFGLDNCILWLPDVFGYSGALPQIMKECGTTYFMTTKLAWNQFNQHPYDTFMWQGIDGTQILTHLITTVGVGQDEKNYFTTYNGMLHPDSLIGGWNRYQNKGINNDILVSYGYGDGGGGPTRAMLETSRRMEKGITGLPQVRQCFARQYFDELNDRVKDNPRLPVWVGELYFEYHRGTYTSMARNKRSNRKAEIHLMDVELLSVLTRETMPYPVQQLDSIWKTVMVNQFHDILPGSSIHQVYEDTKKDYAEVEAQLTQLREPRLKALAGEGDAVTIFNTKGFDSDEVVRLPAVQAAALRDEEGNLYPVQHTDDGAVVALTALPAKGWRSYALESAQAEAAASPFTWQGEHSIQTPHYIIELDDAGMLTRLYDRQARREVLKDGQPGNVLRMYEDKPIYYDCWDIDIYYSEKSWVVDDVQSIRWVEKGPVRATLEVVRRVSNSLIRQRMHLYADSRRIDFDTWVDWQEHQHLLKVHFPVDVHTDEATFDIQFGNLKRKVHQNTSWDEARFESCGQKWMDASEGHYGVSLLNDCKYGYSMKDGSMALTLIKSGIEPNPTADQEEHVFTYALFSHQGDWRQGGTVREGYRLNQPALAVMGGKMGNRFSLAHVDQPNVVLETIKQAEDGDGIIVRLYESDNARTACVLHWQDAISSVEECNCLEEKYGDVAFENSQIAFDIKPYQIKTFRIRP